MEDGGRGSAMGMGLRGKGLLPKPIRCFSPLVYMCTPECSSYLLASIPLWEPALRRPNSDTILFSAHSIDERLSPFRQCIVFKSWSSTCTIVGQILSKCESYESLRSVLAHVSHSKSLKGM